MKLNDRVAATRDIVCLYETFRRGRCNNGGGDVGGDDKNIFVKEACMTEAQINEYLRLKSAYAEKQKRKRYHMSRNEVVRYYAMEAAGVSAKKIAAELGVTVQAIYNRRHRGKETERYV